MRWLIVCSCGHQFTRATICRKDLRTWECPRLKAWKMRNPILASKPGYGERFHQTHGERMVTVS